MRAQSRLLAGPTSRLRPDTSEASGGLRELGCQQSPASIGVEGEGRSGEVSQAHPVPLGQILGVTGGPDSPHQQA